MKKITYFLTALFTWMFAVSASAEGGVTVATSYTAASELTDGYYVLKTRCKGKNGYIYHNPNRSDRPFRQKLEASVPLTAVGMNMEYVWKLTKNTTDETFTLQNVGTAAYMPANDGNGGNFANSTALENAAKYKFSTFTAYTNSLAGGVLLYETNFTNTRYVHCNETDEPNLSYWEGGEAKDNGSVVQFAFYKVENLDEAKIATYTINYKIGDNTVFSATNKGVKGETFSVAPTSEPTKLSNYLTKETLTGNLVLSDDNNVFNVVYSKGIVPFTFSTAESKTWYTLSLRNAKDKNLGAGNYLIRQDNNNIKTGNNDGLSKFDAANVTTFERFNGGVWAFVESGFGVKLMNKFTGTYVKVDGGDHKAYLDATGTVFYVQTTSAEGAGFSLQYDGKSYLGDHKGGNLGTWTPNVSWGEDAQNDGGSGFAIHDANLDTYVSVGKSAATASLDALTANEEVDGKLTINTETSIAAAKAAVPSATTVDALNAAYAKSYNVEPTAYYRIKNVSVNDNQNAYVSSENIFVGTDGKLSTSYNANNGLDRVVRRVSATGNYASQLWQFVDNNNGTFKLRNANTGCCLGAYESDGAALEMPIDNKHAGEYTLKATTANLSNGVTNDSKSMLQLVNEGHTMNAFQGSHNNTITNYDNHDGDNGNYWQFIKVTTVPVSISAANYATVAYPFAVKVPAESGVKAYAVSAVKNGMLELSEITDGIIAANTGAILYHEGEKQVNLEITNEAATYTGANKLQGATAKRTGFAANDTYVLALNSENQAAFLKSELTTVPANKAYVLASALPAAEAGAQALNFGFGEVTGINGVNADSNNAVEYYDLNGRRVLYPANGIFVTNTGKKVFIK